MHCLPAATESYVYLEQDHDAHDTTFWALRKQYRGVDLPRAASALLPWTLQTLPRERSGPSDCRTLSVKVDMGPSKTLMTELAYSLLLSLPRQDVVDLQAYLTARLQKDVVGVCKKCAAF